MPVASNWPFGMIATKSDGQLVKETRHRNEVLLYLEVAGSDENPFVTHIEYWGPCSLGMMRKLEKLDKATQVNAEAMTV